MQIKLCYYNQHWNIYLYTKDGYGKWANHATELVTKKDDRGEYRLRTYNHPDKVPIYGFGFMTNDPKQRPGHGGEWSSNSSKINEVFNVDLYEIAVDQISVAVPMSWLKDLLGDRVTWTPASIYREWISDVAGQKNEYMKWIEL